MPGHLTVLELTDPRWGEFVARQPSATPFHHPDWGKLVATCYGFRAFAVATSDATGEIRAGLPVIEVRHLQGRFFRMLWESVIRTGLGSALIAEASGQPVAAEVFLSWNGTTISKFSASDERAWSLRANNLITWHLIKTACEQGSQWLDFGQTDAGSEGLRVFKRSWGAAEEPLIYTTLGIRPEPAPARDSMADHLLASIIRYSPPVLCRAVGETLYRYAA
jgi:CelD/BcsL family acetyltransferase involved in cellulose biosynthesis